MKINKLIYVLSILFITVSCSEDFLETYPTDSLSQEQVGAALAVNPAAAEGTLFGIYEQFYRLGSGGGQGQEDFGLKIIDINTDILSGDMAHTGKSYGRQTSISELQETVSPDYRFNYMHWRMLYRLINLSNLVIDGLGGADETGVLGDLDTAGKRQTMGQALGARAYAYYLLCHLYVDDISDTSKEVLPLYTSAEQSEQPKSSLATIMNLVISDLLAAEDLLDGFVRKTKIEINQDLVRAFLAYSYGALNNWEKCEEYAAKVVGAGYPVMSNAEVLGGFNNINNHPGIMWGIDLTTSQELASLFTWWGFMDVFSYSYAGVGNRKSMDADLFAEIRADDIRQNQFPWSVLGPSWIVPCGKFYNDQLNPDVFTLVPYSSTAVSQYSYRFSGPQVNVTSDSHYMRIAEMYLLHAEASLMNNKEAQAKQSLKAVADLRIGDTSYIDALSGADLMKEIDIQTRLELFGEGKSYFLMKRQRKTITRGSNWLDFTGESFNHNDDKLTFEIPEDEILFNPNISGQN